MKYVDPSEMMARIDAKVGSTYLGLYGYDSTSDVDPKAFWNGVADVVGVVFEPVDWYCTGRDIINGDFQWTHALALAPFVSHAMVSKIDDVVDVVRGLDNVISWNKGSFDGIAESLEYHFRKHGSKVGAKDVEQYVRKAERFATNLKGAKKYKIDGVVEGVIRYVKNGKYIDLAPDGKIIQFGSIKR